MLQAYQVHTVRDPFQKSDAKKVLPNPQKLCQKGKSSRSSIHIGRSQSTKDFRDYYWWPAVYRSCNTKSYWCYWFSVLYLERYCELVSACPSVFAVRKSALCISMTLTFWKEQNTSKHQNIPVRKNPTEVPKHLVPMLPGGDPKLKIKSAYFFFFFS